MRILALLREAEHLGDGFWRPTPNRLVHFPDGCLLISPVATRELQRHFPTAERLGYARAVDASEAIGLPSQALDGWLDPGLPISPDLVQRMLSMSFGELKPTHLTGSVQFFDVESQRDSTYFPRWSSKPPQQLKTQGSFAICRQHLSPFQTRHFIGRLAGEKVVAESDESFDPARLTYSLAAACGKPLCISTRDDGESTIFDLRSPLPRAERRLLLAIGIRERNTSSRSYRVRRGPLTMLLHGKLAALGASLRKTI